MSYCFYWLASNKSFKHNDCPKVPWKKAVFINIMSIILVSLVFAIIVNIFMPNMQVVSSLVEHEHESTIQIILAGIFAIMLGGTLVNKYLIKKLTK